MKKNRPVRSVFPDYLSVSYDYGVMYGVPEVLQKPAKPPLQHLTIQSSKRLIPVVPIHFQHTHKKQHHKYAQVDNLADVSIQELHFTDTLRVLKPR